jgi:hypothetical protein
MDLDQLNQLVQDHSPHLSAGTFAEEVARVPEVLHDTVQYKFLEAVRYYSAQHKAESKDWDGAAHWFLALQDQAGTTPFLAFYIPNYLLLSSRNAGAATDMLEVYFEQAQAAALKLDEPVRYQLLGFLQYNWSRCLHKVNRVDDAIWFYNLGGEHRVRFYQHLQQSGANEAEIKAAATQVWKIREDWSTFFPGRDISECVVSEELHAEVAPLANPDFSAALSLKGAATVVGLVLLLFLGDPLARYFQLHGPSQNDNSGEFLRSLVA